MPPIDIGRIEAWRIVSSSGSDVEFWADQINQAGYDAFNWLLNERPADRRNLVLRYPVLFVECMELEPMWRGLGLALPAIATFLDVLTCKPDRCLSLLQMSERGNADNCSSG